MITKLVPYVGIPGDSGYHEIITICETEGNIVSNKVYSEDEGMLIVETEYEVEGVSYIATIEHSVEFKTFYFFRKNMQETEE